MSRRRYGVPHAVAVNVLAVVVAGALVTAGQGAVAVAQADPPGCTRTPQGSGERIECTEGVPAGVTLKGTDGDDVIVITGKARAAGFQGYGEKGGVGNAGTVDSGEGVDTITVTGGAGGNVAGVEEGHFAIGGGSGGDGNTGSIITGSGTTTVSVTGGHGGKGEILGAHGGHGGDAWLLGGTLSTRGALVVTLTGGDGGDGAAGHPKIKDSGGGGEGGSGIFSATTLKVTGSPTTGVSFSSRGGRGGDGTASGPRATVGGKGGAALGFDSEVVLTPLNDLAVFAAGDGGMPKSYTKDSPALSSGSQLILGDGDDSAITIGSSDEARIDCGFGNGDSYVYTEDPAFRYTCESVGRQ